MKDATYEKALNCAARQLESYARRGKLSTEAERRAALDDALQHAVGIIELENFREERAAIGNPRNRVNL